MRRARGIAHTAQRAAFPVGGIGEANVSVDARGELEGWELENHPDEGRRNPYSFFAIHAHATGVAPVARVPQALRRWLDFGIGLPADDPGFGTLVPTTTDHDVTMKPQWVAGFWPVGRRLAWDDLVTDGLLSPESAPTLEDRPRGSFAEAAKSDSAADETLDFAIRAWDRDGDGQLDGQLRTLAFDPAAAPLRAFYCTDTARGKVEIDEHAVTIRIEGGELAIDRLIVAVARCRYARAFSRMTSAA